MLLRLLDTRALDGATNMALDEALLERARQSGDVTVRAYTWARPTLSLGRHQTARGVYDPALAAAHGIDVVRRPTGGRAVLHARELTYSVTAPVGALAGPDAPPRAAYERINAMLAAALLALGVCATSAPRAARARRPDGAPCFDAPAAGELVAGADARKLVGSAQWQERGALLQHGSLLIENDQPLLAACATAPLASYTAPTTLAALLGRTPDPDEVGAALFSAAATLATDIGAADVEFVHVPDGQALCLTDPALRADLARLLPRYTDPEWTWRR